MYKCEQVLYYEMQAIKCDHKLDSNYLSVLTFTIEICFVYNERFLSMEKQFFV